jgi:putative SOS response-associated peptidase YedK
MCGRFTLAAGQDELLKAFKIEDVQYEHTSRYNIAPTQLVPGVVLNNGKRSLQAFYWGLLPSWAKTKKIAYSTFNARSESIQSKPAFRSVFTRNRMIIASDGFFEWSHKGKEKQPYRFRLKSKDIFAFAGLFDHWKSPEGDLVQSCTIITTKPNSLTEKVHDRMPVILSEEDIKLWLDPEINDKDFLQSLLQPYDANDMYTYPVSKSVGNVRNQTPDLIDEIPLNSL